MNAAEAAKVADGATQYSVFCMEAMWSRFIPLMAQIKDTVDRGDIGEIVHVSSDFGLRQTPQSNARLFDQLNGGVVRDLAAAVKRRLIAEGKSLRSGYQSNRYQYQALEVMRCMDRGQLSSDIMPLSQSITIMNVVDAALRQA